MSKQPLPLRDTRAAAERAARDYAERYRQYDPLIETGITALGDGSGWRLNAYVEDPTKHTIKYLHGIMALSFCFPGRHKDYFVKIRKRKT